MDPLATIQPAPNLHGFCQHVLAQRSDTWPPEETYLADTFVTFYRLDYIVTFSFSNLADFCRSLGIAVSLTKLPAGLRGHNCVYEAKREIVIAETTATAAALGSREHTLLHELREIIECEFVKLKAPIASDYEDREERADDFASHVRAAIPLSMMHAYLETAGTPEWTLGEVCFAVIFGIAMALYVVSCMMLPQWEDQLPT